MRLARAPIPRGRSDGAGREVSERRRCASVGRRSGCSAAHRASSTTLHIMSNKHDELMYAAHGENEEEARMVLGDEDVTGDGEDSFGRTALCVAAHRGRTAMCHAIGDPETWRGEDDRLCDEEWLRSVLPSEGLSTVTILDCSVDSALMFSQGSWDYVRRDLGSVGVPAGILDRLEVGPCVPVIEAFNLRRELVNYKKVCLHIAAEARRLEVELHQHAAFHFRSRQGDAVDDMLAQLHVSLETEAEALAEVQHAVRAGCTDSLEHSERTLSPSTHSCGTGARSVRSMMPATC